MDYIAQYVINQDTIACLERLVGDNYRTPEKVRKKILGGKRNGNTNDTRACYQGVILTLNVEKTYMSPINQMIHLAIFWRISTMRSSISVSVFSASAVP